MAKQLFYMTGASYYTKSFFEISGNNSHLKKGWVVESPYEAIIRPYSFIKHPYANKMKDNLGESVLFGIYLSETRFGFSKKYNDRPYSIHYSFEERENNLWIGIWKIIAVESGPCYCTLVPMKDDTLILLSS